MHWCKDCKATKSGSHLLHKDNPLFLSYNYMLNIRRLYPHIWIFPQKHYSERLMDALRVGHNEYAYIQRRKFMKKALRKRAVDN